MTEPMVSVDFVIRTVKGVYTVQEALLEKANLETALADIKKKQVAIEAAKKLDNGGLEEEGDHR